MTTGQLNDHTPQPWLDALQAASDDLRHLVDGSDDEELSRRSSAGKWTVAQVLSHLGSGAQICTELVRRGIAGDDLGPQRDDLVPIWGYWDALSPTEQREQWERADATHIELLATITATSDDELRVPYFAGPMDLTTYLGYRLSEHALHGWDIAVAYDPSATVGQLDLVWQRIDMVASRFHDLPTARRLAPQRVSLRHDDHQDTLHIDEEVHIQRTPEGAASTTVDATTDVLTRLIYGRLRSEDRLETTGPMTRADLTQLFPGF